jgi:hypothetical protein
MSAVRRRLDWILDMNTPPELNDGSVTVVCKKQQFLGPITQYSKNSLVWICTTLPDPYTQRIAGQGSGADGRPAVALV